MANIKLCKTKAGKGFKIVVDKEWYYTSNSEMGRMLNGLSRACNFRQIEDNDDENKGGQPEKQAGPHIEVLDDEDDFNYQETGLTKELHAYQDYMLEHDDGGEE